MIDYLNPSRIYTNGLNEVGASIYESTTTGKEYLQVATFKGFLTVRPDAPNYGTESRKSAGESLEEKVRKSAEIMREGADKINRLMNLKIWLVQQIEKETDETRLKTLKRMLEGEERQ